MDVFDMLGFVANVPYIHSIWAVLLIWYVSYKIPLLKAIYDVLQSKVERWGKK